MSHKRCVEAFTEPTDSIVAAVNAASAEPCECERYQRGSTGAVHDAEVLCFIISTPGALAPNGHLLPPYLMQLDRNGLSTLRGAADQAEFEVTIKELQERWAANLRRFHGVFTFKVSDLRYNESGRFLCVYDTPLEGRPHHADIMAPDVRGPDAAMNASQQKKLQARRRKAMIDKVGTAFEGAAEFRGGALAYLVEPPVETA